MLFDETVNFMVRYEIDGDRSSHVLSLEHYQADGPVDSWVLLDNYHEDDNGGARGGEGGVQEVGTSTPDHSPQPLLSGLL